MMAVREPGSLPPTAIDEPLRIEPGPKSLEVFVRELVDADENDKPRRIVRGRGPAGSGEQDAKCQEAQNSRRKRVFHEVLGWITLVYWDDSRLIGYDAGPRLGRGNRPRQKAFGFGQDKIHVAKRFKTHILPTAQSVTID